VSALDTNTQPAEPAASVGEAVKGQQTGQLPLGTVDQILERAPNDLVEETLEVPEWGCSVKVRSFTAGQNAVIKQRGLAFKGEDTKVAWAEMEIAQFQQGVVDPRFTEEQVRKLHATSGRGFARVIQKLDDLSGTDKEALRKAQDEFQGADD
jgi:hypothetical protein